MSWRWLALLLVALGGCATPTDDRRLDAALRSRPIVLFGEVHDNAAQHALRHAALARWIDAGARPTIVMEQFDRERQGDLDRALAEPGLNARRLVEVAGGGGWKWDLLEPTLELAIRHRLPVVASNLSRADARRVIREGLGAIGLAGVTPAEVEAVLADEIVASHCGQVDVSTARSMVRAQVARDRVMAAAVERAAERGPVVLLAGNGHVRRDVGVPRWLGRPERAVSIGLLERPAADAPPFDLVVETLAADRADPCAAPVVRN